MKVGIITAKAPFIYGGAEFFADGLKDRLIEYGHEAEIIKIHYSWHSLQNVVDGMLAARCMELINMDLAIPIVFPAYLVKHPRKKLWLIHQFRQAYELEGTEYDPFSMSQEDQNIKKMIHNADNKFLKELEGNIYTNSHVVSERLKKYNGISSEILYPPLINAETFSCGDFGDYFFYPSRVCSYKRQYMAVEAMKYVKSNVKLVIAGKGDSKKDEEFLQSKIEEYNLADKVTYLNRFISEDEKIELFRNCLGGIYIPYDEDSYGYVGLETIQSKKPLLTFSDSGGTDVIVQDGINGYITEPSAQQLAEAMDRLYYDKKKARTMGENGIELINSLGINWENVIRRLTE